MTREDELILKKHKRKHFLSLFRNTLSRVSHLKSDKLNFDVSVCFDGLDVSFRICVFIKRNNDNTSLAIYDFWDIKKSQKLIEDYISAIRTDDFEKIKAAERYL